MIFNQKKSEKNSLDILPSKKKDVFLQTQKERVLGHVLCM